MANRPVAYWRDYMRKRRQPNKDMKLLIKMADFLNRTNENPATLDEKYAPFFKELLDLARTKAFSKWFATFSVEERRASILALLAESEEPETDNIILNSGDEVRAKRLALKKSIEYLQYRVNRAKHLGVLHYLSSDMEQACSKLGINVTIDELKRVSDVKLKKALLEAIAERKEQQKKFAKLVHFCDRYSHRCFLRRFRDACLLVKKRDSFRIRRNLVKKGVVTEKANPDNQIFMQLTPLGEKVIKCIG